MKKKSGLLLVWAWLAVQAVQACDVCGCAVNATYFGILPQFRQHFAGVRYMSNNFTSKALPSLFKVKNPTYTESLQRMEVYGRYYPTNRLQLFAFIPYQYNTRTEGGAVTESKGLSDATVIGNYILFNTGDSGRMLWRNTLSIGGGLKLPTGRYDASGAASQQTGSGTVDYLLNAIYTTRYKKVGLNVDVNARFNGSNGLYQYGNRFTSSTRFFYWHRYKSMSVLPHTGFLVEYASKDAKRNIIQKYTGGSGCYSATGVDVYFRKCSFGVAYTIPLSERLNEGYSVTESRLSAQLIYLF